MPEPNDYVKNIQNYLHEISMQASDLVREVTSRQEDAKKLGPAVAEYKDTLQKLAVAKKDCAEWDAKLVGLQKAYREFQELAKK